ncbi:MAG: hypothetical protein ACUVTR_06250 [Dehalococcoidia bacterium]
MANNSQENGTTILLGLKGCEVGTVAKEEGKIVVEVKTKERNPVCRHCSSVRLYRYGSGGKSKRCTVGAMAKRSTFSYPASAGDAGTVVTLSTMVLSYSDLIPG